jgi:hypothetical protein
MPISRILLLSTVLFCTSFAACSPVKKSHSTLKVLFVGNSLTYVGNLPAVLDALAASNGKSIQSDMLVKGGATLTQRLTDGTVSLALSGKKYDYVVLQERGGDVTCAFGPKSCKDAESSLIVLAKTVVQNGATPIYLGTYQALPEASEALVNSESSMAARNSIAYVPVSNIFQSALHKSPESNWLYSDGMHPGADLILLEAVLLYRNIYSELLGNADLLVSAPMYIPSSKFSDPSPTSKSTNSSGVVAEHKYDSTTVSKVLQLVRTGTP